MSEWVVKRLSTIVDILSGGTPKTDVPEYWNGNIYWLAVNDFAGDLRWVRQSEKKITESGVKNSATKILNQGDLIVSARGTVGEIAQIGTPMAFNQSCYGLRGKSGYSNDFLYYAIKQQLAQLKLVANGAVFDTITLKSFDHIKLPVPSLPTQTRIAEILSAYDDAIENNNRRIVLLEKASRELYREWFVRMRFPGHEDAIFIDGLPKGWKKTKLGQICIFNYGKALQGEKRVEGSFPVYSSAGIIGHHNEPLVYSDGIIVGRKGTVGSVYYSSVPFFCIDTAYFVMPKENCNIYYLYHLLSSMSLVNLNTDSAVPGLNRNTAYRQTLYLPSPKLLSSFEDIASSNLKQIDNLQQQSQNLARQRDLLLPRLMSGQLEV